MTIQCKKCEVGAMAKKVSKQGKEYYKCNFCDNFFMARSSTETQPRKGDNEKYLKWIIKKMQAMDEKINNIENALFTIEKTILTNNYEMGAQSNYKRQQNDLAGQPELGEDIPVIEEQEGDNYNRGVDEQNPPLP